MHYHVNTLRPRQHGRHFTDDTFNCIFVNENVRISIKFSLKFVPKGPINNIPALVQIMAWCRPGNKPLSEPVMVSLLAHICVTRPQWVKLDCVMMAHDCAARCCYNTQFSPKLANFMPNGVADIDGLVQHCSISIAITLEILQSCTKPLIWNIMLYWTEFLRTHKCTVWWRKFSH